MEFLKSLTGLGQQEEIPRIDELTDCNHGSVTVTENGETAFDGLGGEKVLDFFGTVNRDSSISNTVDYFRNAWNENPELTLKTLFNFRDIRGGKGERTIPRVLMFVIKLQDPDLYANILPAFVELGYWKDVNYLAELSIRYDMENISTEVDLFTNQLNFDRTSQRPSLCAKWAPSEGSHYDKAPILLAQRIRKGLELSEKGYRKLLSSLRTKIKIVESQLSQGNLDQINFGQIPSRAHLLYKKAFWRDKNATGVETEARRRLSVRYQEYLINLEKGVEKVNYKGIMPHEIVNKIHNYDYDAVLEQQWAGIRQELEDLGVFERCVSIVDVSGSMYGQPMDVAIALGILISECAQGPFRHKVITFHHQPHFISLEQHEHLYQKVKTVKGMEWGMNTDIEKVFDRMLEMGRFNNLTAEQMPNRLFIFTDMQFDQVSGRRLKTFDKIAERFEREGYQMPQVICWNLRTVGPVPFQHTDEGVAMLSGFSAELLKSVLTGDSFTPMDVFLNAVNHYVIPSGVNNYPQIGEIDTNRLEQAVKQSAF